MLMFTINLVTTFLTNNWVFREQGGEWRWELWKLWIPKTAFSVPKGSTEGIHIIKSIYRSLLCTWHSSLQKSQIRKAVLSFISCTSLSKFWWETQKPRLVWHEACALFGPVRDGPERKSALTGTTLSEWEGAATKGRGNEPGKQQVPTATYF